MVSGTFDSHNNPINLEKVKVTQSMSHQLESGQDSVLIQNRPLALLPAVALYDHKIVHLLGWLSMTHVITVGSWARNFKQSRMTVKQKSILRNNSVVTGRSVFFCFFCLWSTTVNKLLNFPVSWVLQAGFVFPLATYFPICIHGDEIWGNLTSQTLGSVYDTYLRTLRSYDDNIMSLSLQRWNT